MLAETSRRLKRHDCRNHREHATLHDIMSDMIALIEECVGKLFAFYWNVFTMDVFVCVCLFAMILAGCCHECSDGGWKHAACLGHKFTL